MGLTIKEVASAKDFKAFIRFPHQLYRDCPQWVPPFNFDEKSTLRPASNPAFDFCRAQYWLAVRDGRIVGRIAGIINDRINANAKNKFMRFGWLDFVDDPAVSARLFATVETWAKEQGMDGVQGPMGFSDFDKSGLLVEGFDEFGSLAGNYNYPYYVRHLENLSYQKEVDWLEFKIRLTEDAYKKIDRLASIVEKRYRVRTLPLKSRQDILRYKKQVLQLINDCYRDLFGFIPLTERQQEYYWKTYFGFVRPAFVQFVVDEQHTLLGFGFTIPSLAQALKKSGGSLFPFGFLRVLHALYKNDTVDLLLIAIREDYQGKGLNALIMREGYKAYVQHHITMVEATRQLETNHKVLTLWEHFDARQHKRIRCYTKRFT